MRKLLVLGALIASAGCSAGDGEEDAGAVVPDSATAAGGAAGAPAGRPPGDDSLAGVRWNLVSVGGTPAEGLEPARHPFIEFDAAAGRAGGNASCNRFSGPYALAGDSLGFGPLVSTRMACIEPALNTQETAYLGALAEVTGWRMSGDTLVMSGPAGDLARFVAAPDTLAVR